MNKKDATARLKELLKAKLHYPQIATKLNLEGLRTPKGKKWNAQHIATWVFVQGKSSKQRKPAMQTLFPALQSQKPTTITHILASINLSDKRKVQMIRQLIF